MAWLEAGVVIVRWCLVGWGLPVTFALDAIPDDMAAELLPALVDTAVDGVIVVDVMPVLAGTVEAALATEGVTSTGVALGASETVVAPYRTGETSAVPVLSVFKLTVLVGTRFGNDVLLTSGSGRRLNAASLGKACRPVNSTSNKSLFRSLTVG